MKAHTTPRPQPWNLNHLQRGQTYRASTTHGITVGEYLGIEAPHGDWAILLRHGGGARSIKVTELTDISRAA